MTPQHTSMSLNLRYRFMRHERHLRALHTLCSLTLSEYVLRALPLCRLPHDFPACWSA